jgi:hypothetical protein
MIHPYIFFRAPYFFKQIDYTSIETEITSSFGEGQYDLTSKAWIRVDSEKTFVYSSEIRANYSPSFYYNSPEYLHRKEQEIQNLRKRMTDYLQIIDENARIQDEPDKKRVYNLFTSEVKFVPKSYNLDYPWNSHDVSKQSEVLVRIPHLTPNYFVKCT